MSILITGGGGFVGLSLAERLLAEGESVVLFDRVAPPEHLLSRLAQSRLRVVVGDICSAIDVDTALGATDVTRVVHAAAITPDAAREARDPMSVVDVNIGGTVNLLLRCAAAGSGARRIERLLMLSSVAVYGITPPTGEQYEEARSHPAPVALYGITKLASEQAALRLGSLLALDVRVARLGPVYGPWEYATGVRDTLSPQAQVLAAALAGDAAVLPRSMRADWIYSRDAGAALAALALAPMLRHALYNVGGSVMTDLRQYCELLAARHPGWAWSELAPGGDAGQATVRYSLPVDRAGLSIDRLRADTGWTPAFTLAEAVSDQLTWQAQPGSHLQPSTKRH